MRWRAILLVLLGVLHACPGGAQDAVPLTFVGGSDGYKLTRFTPDFQDQFEILPSNGKEALATLTVPELRAPGQTPQQVALLVDGKPFKNGDAIRVPPTGVVLSVSATLPAAAVYLATIKVFMPDRKPLLTPLQITRVMQQLPLEFRDLETVVVDTGDMATATFGLRETAGLGVTVNPPALIPLVRLENNKRIAATAGVVVQQLSLAPPGGKLSPVPANSQQSFGAGEIKTYALGFQSPVQAGEYSGTIRVSAANRPEVERAFSVLVHDPAIYAVLWILLGIVLAQGLRWFFQVRRPAMLRSQRALAVLERLGQISAKAGIDDDALQVVRSMEQRIQAAYQQIQIGQGDAAEPVVAEVEGKLGLLELWCEGLQRVAALGSSPIAPPIRDTVRGVRSVLVDPAATAGAIATAANTLQGIPADVERAQRDDFVKARDALVAALAKNPGGAGHLPTVQAVVAHVQRLVNDANQQFNQGRVEDARTLIAKARQAYVVVLADEMQNQISGAAPIGYTAAEWQPLAAEMTRLLRLAKNDIDADRAWSEYDAARRLYFRYAIEGLSREKDSIERQVDAVKQLNANSPQAAAAGVSLASAARAIAQAQSDATSNLDAAFQSISDADRALRQASAQIQNGVAVMGAVQNFLDFFNARSIPALAPGAPPAAVAPIAAPQALQVALVRSSYRWDLFITALVALLAVLLGMKALWFGNHTWGGAQDYTIAVLWGMGLHGFSFDGVSGLAQKFTTR